MPKQEFIFDKFSLGLNDQTDPRKLLPGELSQADSVMVDEVGKVRPMGKQSTSGMPAANAVPIESGYGLFAYSTDRDLAGNEDGEDWLAVADPTSSQIDIYDRDNGGTPAWSTGLIDLGTSPNMKAIFNIVDGVLRVSDANFGTNNKNQWRRYIEREKFQYSFPSYSYGTGGYKDDGWFSKDAGLAVPVWENFAHRYGGAYNTAAPTPVNALEISVALHSNFTPAGGSDMWQIALSYVYEDNQESLLAIWQNAFAFDGFETAANNTFVELKIKAGALNHLNERLIAVKVYLRKYYADDTSTSSTSEEWFLAAKFDFDKGIDYPISSTDLTAADLTTYKYVWNYSAPVHQIMTPTFEFTDLTETYFSQNGFSHKETSISFLNAGEGYKTAVMINRQLYVGNTKRLNQNGQTVVEGDSIYKSSPNKFDTFPLSRKIIIAKGDGESIVRFMEYADRLLEFKQRTLRIIDCSQENEYLESKHKFKGITHSAATCETDFGIAWVNEKGLYLYDGREVINLLERDNKMFIKPSTWAGFITDDSIIGYYPQKRHLIILKDSSPSNVGDVYVFDLVTGSLTYGDSKFTDNQKQTNFVNDWNGDLVLMHTNAVGTVVKWDDDSQIDLAKEKFATWETDFNAPGVKKFVYDVFVTYRNATGAAGSNYTNLLYYVQDGGTVFINTDLTGAFVPNQTIWAVAKFTFGTKLECETIRFQVRGGTNGTQYTKLEVSKIVVVVRVLPYKRVA